MPMNLSKLWIALSELGNWAMEQSVAEVPADLALCEFDCRKSALGTNGLTVNVAFPELPENSCLASGRNTSVMFGPSKPIGN